MFRHMGTILRSGRSDGSVRTRNRTRRPAESVEQPNFAGVRRVLGSVVVAAVLAGSAAGAVPAPQQISNDPFTDPDAQHSTAVEPDSFSFGDTVVAVFQVGRRATGGASGIGFATSHDGGHTWTSGVLPPPPGVSLTFVSDPAIAYDRVHGVWIASVLGGRAIADGVATSLLASHSTDGVSWTTTVVDPD